MNASDPRQDRSGAPESSQWRAAVRRSAPAFAAAVPVALVNATAFIGQFAWVQAHVPWILPEQVMFAVAIESVAVYLAWSAHKAQLANDSAGRLKLGAYLFALIIGAMNYSHYAVGWKPNALAVALGLMSALSPWLWGVHSRRVSRDALKARGLVEEHAVRLGATRVLWHPLRATVVMSRSAWTGENDPKRAIAEYEEARQHMGRAGRRAMAQGAPYTALPRQEIEEMIRPGGAPEAAQAAGAPAIEAAPSPAPVAQPAPQPAEQQPAPVPAPPAPVTVKAIAPLAASPRIDGRHDLDPQLVAAAVAHLNSLVASELPSDRAVGKMLCPVQGHNHRRPALDLINARKALGQDPVQLPRSLRSVNDSMIASPASNRPGGAAANG